MAKKTSSGTKDNGLNHVKDNVERLVVTEGEPADYAGVAAATLGDVAFGSGDVTGPADEGTGRKNTYAAKEGVDVDEGGTANHVCLVDDQNDELLVVTTLSNPQAVTQGNTMDVAAWEHTIPEAT